MSIFRKLQLALVLTLGLLLIPLAAQAQTAQTAPVDPSFQLVRGVPDTCAATVGEEFRFETVNNVSFGSGSNQATLSVDGVGQVSSFAGNHNQPEDYPSIGDGFYDFVIEQGYDVPLGTSITVEITTYTGLNQTGQLAYRSTLVYDCDLGGTISIDNQNLLGVANTQPTSVLDLPPVDPAFELVQGVPDTCSATAGEEFRFDTFNNASFGSGSNQATLSVEGIGQVATFAGNHDEPDDYPSVGNGFYDFVIQNAYEVPDGTTITVEITTYTGLDQTGQLAYRSTLVYDCALAETANVSNQNLLTDNITQPGTPPDLPAVDPAFTFTQGIANTCSALLGETIRFDTLNNVTFGSGSNRSMLSVAGVGEVSVFQANHNQTGDYPSIGDGFYDFVIDAAYDVPANTTITAEITTYTGLNLTGQAAYRSTLTYDCTTGEVITLDNENLLVS